MDITGVCRACLRLSRRTGFSSALELGEWKCATFLESSRADDNAHRGEYPAGSVACAESSGELKAGQRNR